MPNSTVLQTFERSKFAILLVCLLGLFVIQPMLSLQPTGEERIGADAAMIAVLLASSWSLGHRRSVRVTGLVLVAGAIAAAWLAHFAPGRAGALVALLAAIAALSFAAAAILWHLVRERNVRPIRFSAASACISCWAACGR